VRGVTVVPNADVRYLDRVLLGPDGILRTLPASELGKIPQVHLSIWAGEKGIYCFPSTEMIEWLRDKVGGRSAIEICAGFGVIGRSLGIPMTDSYMQTSTDMVLYYKSLGQVPISPPQDVLKFEANEAVDHFRPDVVVAAYATQKYLPGDEVAGIGSSIYGVDELSLLPKVKTYITIGNDVSHGDKRIRRFPHTVHRFDWLFSRSVFSGKNHVVVWER
jgi:hypothetical protein